MKTLEEKILSEGEILPGGVLKVGNFLNQQIDIEFLMEMGREIADGFKDDGVTKVLTVEASGIAFAVAAANFLHVPVAFAKKIKINFHRFTSKVKKRKNFCVLSDLVFW